MKEASAGDGILIFGASGHAKVVIDIAEKSGIPVLGLFDDDVALHGKRVYGYEVKGGKAALLSSGSLLPSHCVVVAIGNNAIRTEIAAWLVANGGSLCRPLVHPSAQLARGAGIGNGSVVMAGVVINSDTRVGQNAIVNTGAIIDHDCVIEAAAHVAPGVTLCGGVKVGAGTLIGAGSVVHPNRCIGTNVTVGAGATVLNDVEDGCTVVGSPAKRI
jgi:sugar O-acyltransferase (sialic acid O-acetyltransferase NeuD family)